ncbi:hypothetical protein BLGI_3257 [Brevibacillus laterosporus GI-9]|nr:hypothetical protein BLGI_3257 [Brevibacillus laterosporus GI-9]
MVSCLNLYTSYTQVSLLSFPILGQIKKVFLQASTQERRMD